MFTDNRGKIIVVVITVLVGLSGHLEKFPWLPLWAQHWIELLGFVATLVTAALIDPKALGAGAKTGMIILIAMLGAGVLVSGCGGNLHVKQIGVTTLTSVDATLSAAQDYERAHVAALQLDAPASASLLKICMPATTVAQPTKHQVIACLFRKAFTDEAAAARALQTYRPGDPAPRDLLTLQHDADDVLNAVKLVAPASADFVAKAQAVIDAILPVVNTIAGVVKPAGA